MLARRIAPFATFAAVLGGVVVVGLTRHSGSAPPPHRLPLTSGSRAQDKAAGGALPALAPYYGAGKLVISDDVQRGLPTEGPAYQVHATPGTDRIAALAAALGVSGDVRSDDEGWVVGTGDRTLRVTKTYAASWYLGADKGVVSSGVATARPASVEPCPSPPPDTKVDCGTTPDEPPPPPSPPPAPSDEQARAVAAKVFAAAGLSGADVTVNTGWGTKEVSAAPVIDGLPTSGFQTTVSVDVHGDMTYANGFLGVVDRDATYPLLTPRQAADRGWGGGIEPMIGAPINCPTGSPCPTAPPDRVVTKVRLGLMFAPSYDATDDAYLAPAWLITVEGETYETPLLALPDQYLATPPPATDDVKPVPPATGDTGSGGAVAPDTVATP